MLLFSIWLATLLLLATMNLINNVLVCCKASIGRASVTLSQPPSYHVSLTETASITCSADEYNVSYQWIIESRSFPSKVIGIYNNTLMIPNVTSLDENTYTCMVTTQEGCVSSSTTQLIASGMISY